MRKRDSGDPGLSKKPKLMQNGHADNFQTPAVAILPLLPYIALLETKKTFPDRDEPFVIWEAACGRGNLVRALTPCFNVIGSDINDGRNSLIWQPDDWDVLVTNPPFSIKDAFLERAYSLGKPFALLLPLTALEGQKRQALYRRHGVEVIVLGRRLQFETPSGKQGGSWFASAWFTHGLNVGAALSFAAMDKHTPTQEQLTI